MNPQGLIRNDPSHSDNIDNGVHKLHSRKGRLLALHTKAELDATLQLTSAYTVKIPLKSASSVLKNIEGAIQNQNAVNLQHLRRLVKPEYLPAHLSNTSTGSACTDIRRGVQNHSGHAAIDGGVEGNMEGGMVGDLLGVFSEPIINLLVCAASAIVPEELLKILSALALPLQGDAIRTIRVPLLPPTSEVQAKKWSEDFWPTVYKKHNPFGPHPSIVSRAEDEIKTSAGEWMALAIRAGKDIAAAQKGEPVGAVVVDRNAYAAPLAIAIAGDARWNRSNEADKHRTGNVMAHAVMRVIGLVARKRRDLVGDERQDAEDIDCSNPFEDEPLTSIENNVFFNKTLAPGGYLCVDLELYITHEPCVMCSMAILHSRFGKVIFGHRLPRTGGLSAEITHDRSNSGDAQGGLGYGLFWRPELNWKLLAWQWVDDEPSSEDLSDLNMHA